jgi:hypothetical protein
LENKEMILDSIPIDDIMATPYYNNMIDNNDLDYDITENTKVNETIKTDNMIIIEYFLILRLIQVEKIKIIIHYHINHI